jgi:uncharacterized protein with PQ loop repeat
MTTILIDVIGFTAAIITNISFYPQAYEIYIIVNTHEYEKLNSISLLTFSMTGFGCTLWLIYAIILSIYPMIMGSILTIIPSIYICSVLSFYKFCYKDSLHQLSHSNIHHDGEIIISPVQSQPSQPRV